MLNLVHLFSYDVLVHVLPSRIKSSIIYIRKGQAKTDVFGIAYAKTPQTTIKNLWFFANICP